MSLVKNIRRPAFLKNHQIFKISSSILIAVIVGVLLFAITNNTAFNIKPVFGYGVTVTPEGTTDITGFVNTEGRFTEDLQAYSLDNRCLVNIPSGTVGLTADLQPLTEISIEPMTTPPDPPAGSQIIGIPYQFGPEGATFDPPIEISLTIPDGVDLTGLTLARYGYNANTGQYEWMVLENIRINPDTRTITGETSGFSVFAIITVAPTPPTTTPAPITKPIGIDWALIGGLLAAVVVVSGILWLYLARRHD